MIDYEKQFVHDTITSITMIFTSRWITFNRGGLLVIEVDYFYRGGVLFIELDSFSSRWIVMEFDKKSSCSIRKETGTDNVTSHPR